MSDGHHEIHPALQLFYLLLICIACAIIGGVVSVAIIVGFYGMPVFTEAMSINETSSPEAINAFRIMLAVGNTIFLFLVPPIFFGYLIVRDPNYYLKLRSRVSWILPVVILGIMFFSAPLMEFVININQKMVLPDFLKSVQQWMRDSEDAAQRSVKIVLQMNSPAEFVACLVIVGLLPAIAEEFLFRGALQTILTQWTENKHVAVWVTAFLFSALHLQFFGFFPRLLLGALFGYLVLWSGSIWTSVWAHFINNGLAVIFTYLYQQKLININPNDQHVFNYSAYAFSLLITVFLLVVYKRVADNDLEAEEEELNGEELD